MSEQLPLNEEIWEGQNDGRPSNDMFQLPFFLCRVLEVYKNLKPGPNYIIKSGVIFCQNFKCHKICSVSLTVSGQNMNLLKFTFLYYVYSL